jgi:predicted HicB family RNase H-like nuclease
MRRTGNAGESFRSETICMTHLIMISETFATVRFDKATGLFRGELTLPRGSADFYAADLASLREEGELSLRILREALARL